MKIIILLLLSMNVFALEGVVRVLEAPLFREKNSLSPVIQYLRKGDVIKLHGATQLDDRYDHLAPSNFKRSELEAELQLETKDDEIVEENSEFVPTFDRHGQKAYILREHIFIYYETEKELTQKPLPRDPTDYRLQEPLPANYPFQKITGYRGQFLIGVSGPYSKSYPYNSEVKKKGYESPKAIQFALYKEAPDDKRDRLFLGVNFQYRTYENQYNFVDQRFSRETSHTFGIGPSISYDAYKGDQNRLNITTNLNVNFFHELQVSQESDLGKDIRIYRNYTFLPQLILQYHRKKVINDLDFVLATAFEMEIGTSYKAQNGGAIDGFWRNLGSDNFRQDPHYSLSLFGGLQVAY